MKNYTLRGLVLGNELDGEYYISIYAIAAIYNALYSDTSVNAIIDFVDSAEGSDESFNLELGRKAADFIYDKLAEDACDDDIVNAVYNGDFLYYFSPHYVFSSCMEYKEWAKRVASLLGLKLVENN